MQVKKKKWKINWNAIENKIIMIINKTCGVLLSGKTLSILLYLKQFYFVLEAF